MRDTILLVTGWTVLYVFLVAAHVMLNGSNILMAWLLWGMDVAMWYNAP